MTIDKSYLQNLIQKDLKHQYLNKRHPDKKDRLIKEIEVDIREYDYFDKSGGFTHDTITVKFLTTTLKGGGGKWEFVSIW